MTERKRRADLLGSPRFSWSEGLGEGRAAVISYFYRQTNNFHLPSAIESRVHTLQCCNLCCIPFLKTLGRSRASVFFIPIHFVRAVKRTESKTLSLSLSLSL